MDGTWVELLEAEFGRSGDEATLETDLRRWDVGDDGDDCGLDMTVHCIHEVSRVCGINIMAVFEVLIT
jgi:hypothetical protein